MTECNPQPLLFSSLGRRKIVADFTGGTLTSDAGGLLLREVERRTGLIDRYRVRGDDFGNVPIPRMMQIRLGARF